MYRLLLLSQAILSLQCMLYLTLPTSPFSRENISASPFPFPYSVPPFPPPSHQTHFLSLLKLTVLQLQLYPQPCSHCLLYLSSHSPYSLLYPTKTHKNGNGDILKSLSSYIATMSKFSEYITSETYILTSLMYSHAHTHSQYSYLPHTNSSQSL